MKQFDKIIQLQKLATLYEKGLLGGQSHEPKGQNHQIQRVKLWAKSLWQFITAART